MGIPSQITMGRSLVILCNVINNERSNVMDEKMELLIRGLGDDGLQAFYIYLAADYISGFIMIGLFIFGIRAVWKKVKDDL